MQEMYEPRTFMLMEANDLNKAGDGEKELKKDNSTEGNTPAEKSLVPEENVEEAKENLVSEVKDSPVDEKIEIPADETDEKKEVAKPQASEQNQDDDELAKKELETVEVEKPVYEKEHPIVSSITPQEIESAQNEAESSDSKSEVNTEAVKDKTAEPEKSVIPKSTEEETKVASDSKSEVNTEAVKDKTAESEKSVISKNTEEETKSAAAEKKPELDKVDLTTFSREQLVNRLRNIIKLFDVPVIRHEVEEIKASFYKQYNEEVEELKKKFLESGELEENFAAPIDNAELEIKELLKDFRYRKAGYIHKLENEKDKNLNAKMEVIEAIKNLINRQESLNETFNEFRALQQKFHDIGSIPQNKVRDVWDTYNLHIENFYNYVKINKELRDLDLKKNQTLKEELCQKAENLLEDSSVVNSFKVLQKYHDRWREIGPVPKEVKDELWERFKAATTQINQKHQEYFESLKDQLKDNLKLKTDLCEKAEEMVAQAANSPKAWEAKSKKLIELQQAWKSIGFAPKKDNNKIYDRFRTACDKFFENKREFFKSYKNQQQEHLDLKIALCLRAEEMKDSTDWKKTTDEFINIQKEWKKIGPVPRRQSDAIWERFRTACDAFFENKSKFFSHIDESQADNLAKKQALIEEIKTFKNLEDNEKTFKKLQEYQSEFMEIGHVPYKEKDTINQEFRNEINKHFDSLHMDEHGRNVQKYRNRLENIKQSDHQNDKLYQERNKLMGKLKQLESDIVVWENNIGFFAKSKSAESVIKDFQHKIETGKHNIKLLQEKIKMLDKIED